MHARRILMVAGVCAVAVVTCAVVFGQRLSPAAATGPLEISAGGFHTCVVTSAGAVECWGLNDFDQLGAPSGELCGTYNDKPCSTTPVGVSGLTSGVVAVTAGGYHTCALTSGGGVKCWGRNNRGQLGNGSIAPSATPVDVSGLTSGVIAVSAGGFHTCALMDTGAVKCWGYNNQGELGDGTAGTDRWVPGDVQDLPDGAAAISAGGGVFPGGGHTCGVTVPGAAVCWGDNLYGQLGDGTAPADSASPVAVVGLAAGVAGIDAGRWHSCALTSGGGVKCWGWNAGGQAGDGTNATRTTPVDVVGLSGGVEALSTGGVHTCALTVLGGVKCWGSNTTGQVGDGTSNNHRTAPVDVLEAPGGQPLMGVAAVEAGGSDTNLGHTCVVMDSGGVKCWGDNEYGQLGDGTTTDRSTPVDVVGYAPKALPTPTPTSTATPTDVPLPTETPSPATVEELIGGLDEAVDALDVPQGVSNSLGAKLDAALQRALRDRPCPAANSVDAFINEVEALERSGRISSEEASALIAQAEAILGQLLAEGGCDS